MKPLLWATLLAVALCTCALAQQTSTILDEDTGIIHFEKMYYPPVAQSGHTEGVVVVSGKLDDHGKVVEAEALSGSDFLVPQSVDNAKKWVFKPNSHRAVIIVYNYRIMGTCRTNTEIAQFRFRPPNFASITGCQKLPMP
jgi:hypothetical protein